MKTSVFQDKFFRLILLLNLVLAVYATPVTDYADAGVYILLSKSFLGYPSDLNFAHRSPLFSIILAGFMLLFKPPLLYKAVIIFQYVLLALTSWMSYQLFRRIFSTKTPALLAALAFNMSFATIYFANLFHTEILTIFLVLLSLTILIEIFEKGEPTQFAVLGIIVGLLTLARFNTVPMVLTFLILLIIVLYYQKPTAIKWALTLGAFIVPYLLIINAWCFYNLRHNGFYGLFPYSGQGVSRNIIVASIRPEDKVSAAYRPVLGIFVEARERYLEKLNPDDQGSLAEFDGSGILTDLYGGYGIYSEAAPQLRQHFNLQRSDGEQALSSKLAPFYKEISEQNKAFILKFRFISLLSGFRASHSGALPAEYGKINLNILPPFAFKLYKLAVMFISLWVFFAFPFFVVRGIQNGWHFDFTLLMMFFIVYSFWGINFVYVTAADANRFKFPAEPLIIGLFVFYALQAWNWVVQRYRSGH